MKIMNPTKKVRAIDTKTWIATETEPLHPIILEVIRTASASKYHSRYEWVDSSGSTDENSGRYSPYDQRRGLSNIDSEIVSSGANS